MQCSSKKICQEWKTFQRFQKVDVYCHIFSVLAGMETALAEIKAKMKEKVGNDQREVPNTAQEKQ